MLSYDEFLKQAAEIKRNRYLKDIDCKECGYQGPPTGEGCCPECGAICGRKMVGYVKNEEPSIQDLEDAQGDVDYQYRQDQTDIGNRIYGG